LSRPEYQSQFFPGLLKHAPRHEFEGIHPQKRVGILRCFQLALLGGARVIETLAPGDARVGAGDDFSKDVNFGPDWHALSTSAGKVARTKNFVPPPSDMFLNELIWMSRVACGPLAAKNIAPI